MNRSFRPYGAALAAAIALTSAIPALAVDFRSVGVTAAVLYDGPSSKGNKLFVAPRGMPVEIVSAVNQWMKVRDLSGDIMWIAQADLSSQRTVIAVVLATVRSTPQESAPAVLQVERGVTLELADSAPAPGWVRVRHRDGVSGYVKSAELWGL
jgi:SH3-like domain-containing protein